MAYDKPAHFDPEPLLDDLRGNAGVLASILAVYGPWHADTVGRLRASAAGTDSDATRRLAHTICGALSQFHARQAVALGRALESHCRDNPAGAARTAELIDALIIELEALKSEIEAYVEHHKT